MNEGVVFVWDRDEKNPVQFKWKWGKEDLPIVDQYTYFGVEICTNCS